MAAPKNSKAVPYFLKNKPIKVSELHRLSTQFETNHTKDPKALGTLNAAQMYLKKYWGFYLSKGKRANIMNDKIKQHFDENAFSQCFMMHQLAITSRDVLIKNKVSLPFGVNGDKPSDEDLRTCMPSKPKVIAPNTPPALQQKGDILRLFASLQNPNSV
eukprot:486436_1